MGLQEKEKREGNGVLPGIPVNMASRLISGVEEET